MLTSGARVRHILEEFSASHPAVLVGTQMVAKGHDFPDVTLVVVADADTALYTPDFRASERTFQLLTQVSGRAGRAERPGSVLVQTWNPDVPCIKMALERDERAFYARELGIRERLGYPPFTRLIRLVTVGEQAQRVQLAAQHLAERLSPHFSADGCAWSGKTPGLAGQEQVAHSGVVARTARGREPSWRRPWPTGRALSAPRGRTAGRCRSVRIRLERAKIGENTHVR